MDMRIFLTAFVTSVVLAPLAYYHWFFGIIWIASVLYSIVYVYNFIWVVL